MKKIHSLQTPPSSLHSLSTPFPHSHPPKPPRDPASGPHHFNTWPKKTSRFPTNYTTAKTTTEYYPACITPRPSPCTHACLRAQISSLTCVFAVPHFVDYVGGWACFTVSIIMIGVLTCVIGDVASSFGCTIGLKDTVTAISFVAIGTSVPGEFTRTPLETVSTT